VGGPTVLTGEEIIAPGHHVIAVGVDRTVDARLSVADEIDDVHRQGGVAIAAHPSPLFLQGFDDAAMARLDGAEICHPQIFAVAGVQRDLEQFAARGHVAAIGSSDFHGLGRLGECRTYVFARDAGAAAILDALRAHRTVVYGRDGNAYGDPALVALAAAHSELRRWATEDAPPGWLDWVSRVCGVIGLGGLVAGGMAGADEVKRATPPRQTRRIGRRVLRMTPEDLEAAARQTMCFARLAPGFDRCASRSMNSPSAQRALYAVAGNELRILAVMNLTRRPGYRVGRT
jgi:hypothetical protein